MVEVLPMMLHVLMHNFSKTRDTFFCSVSLKKLLRSDPYSFEYYVAGNTTMNTLQSNYYRALISTHIFVNILTMTFL